MSGAAEIQKFGTAVKKHMNIREDFAGAYPKEHRKKFDTMRRKQSEVLGYTLTGKVVDPVRALPLVPLIVTVFESAPT